MDTQNIKQQVKELIVERLNISAPIESIQDDTPLFGSENGGLGLDSVDALEVAVAVGSTFDIEVSEKDVAAFRSVESIARMVVQKKGLASAA